MPQVAALLTCQISRKLTNPESVRLLVLARSVKSGQCCVAGKRIVSPRESGEQQWRLGEWIRPVTSLDATCDAMPPQAFPCAPLAKVRIDLDKRETVVAQPENRLWSESNAVRVLGMSNRQKLADIPGLLDEPETLWYDARSGASNRVSEHFRTGESLQLVRVSDLSVYVQNNAMGEERIYAQFAYNGMVYSGLSVTDPQVWSYVKKLQQNSAFSGQTRLPPGDDYWVTVSLTKPFGSAGCRYKVAAAFL